MKPRIVIITEGQGNVAGSIEQDLRFVFSDKVEIERLRYSQVMERDMQTGDIFLLTRWTNIDFVKERIADHDRMILVKRTLREQELIKILEIPRNTRVLVVNDTAATTAQMVELLYSLKIDHIQIVEYDPAHVDRSVTVAITPGELQCVPPHITKIIDVGNRCLDVSTFMDIIYKLQLNDESISMALLKYIGLTVNSNEGVKQQYKDAVIHSIQMKNVLNMSEQGIVMTLPDGEIVLCNQKFREIARCDVVEGVSRIEEVLDASVLESLGHQSRPEDVPICVNGREIIVRQEAVTYETEVPQRLYFFND
ncbi:MAG: hypothetical protein RR320_07640, partial [Oscillospiraceae bacterium]